MGEEGDYITYRYTVTSRMTRSCIKIGSDKSHFNVSLVVRDKITRPCPQTTNPFRRERRAEAESSRGPSAYWPNALLLSVALRPQKP